MIESKRRREQREQQEKELKKKTYELPPIDYYDATIDGPTGEIPSDFYDDYDYFGWNQ